MRFFSSKFIFWLFKITTTQSTCLHLRGTKGGPLKFGPLSKKNKNKIHEHSNICPKPFLTPVFLFGRLFFLFFWREGGRRGGGSETLWKAPIQNGLNKPYIEVESNRTTRNTSIDAQTVLKKTVIFFGGGEGKRDGEGQNWNPMKNAHGESLYQKKKIFFFAQNHLKRRKNRFQRGV